MCASARRIGYLRRMFEGILLPETLIAEVGAYDYVGRNRSPITRYAGLKIKIETARPFISFPLEDEGFARFDSIAGIRKRNLYLLAFFQDEILAGNVFDFVMC